LLQSMGKSEASATCEEAGSDTELADGSQERAVPAHMMRTLTAPPSRQSALKAVGSDETVSIGPISAKVHIQRANSITRRDPVQKIQRRSVPCERSVSQWR